MSRMQAATGEQPLRILLYIVSDELIHAVREADDFWSHIVNEHGAVDAAGVQVVQKLLRRTAEFHNLLEVLAPLLHQLQRMGFEHLHWLDMNVAIRDHSMWLNCSPPPKPPAW